MHQKPNLLVDIETLQNPDGTFFLSAHDALKSYERSYTVLLYSREQDPEKVTTLFSAVNHQLGKNAEGISRCADICVLNDPGRIKCDLFITGTEHLHPQAKTVHLVIEKERAIHWERAILKLRKPRLYKPCSKNPCQTQDTLLVDMDGVLYGLAEYILEIFSKRYPGIPLPKLESHIIQDNFSAEHKPIVQGLFQEDQLFLELPVIEACQEGLSLLSQHYELCICSMPYFAPAPRMNTTAQKMKSLVKDGLAPYFADTVFCRHKHFVHAKGIIEDSPHMLSHHDEEKFKVILYTQEYNKRISAPYRINHWGEKEITGLLRDLRKIS